MPTVPAISVDEINQHSHWLYYAHDTHWNKISKEQVRNAPHAYYDMITYIDDKVGELLAAVHTTGLDENTLVICQ